MSDKLKIKYMTDEEVMYYLIQISNEQRKDNNRSNTGRF